VRHETLARRWLAGLTSPRTRDAYRRDLAAFVAWCENGGHSPLEVGAAEVDEYRDDCGASGQQPSTVARRLSALSSFYDHALAARAVEANPVHSVARPAPSRTQVPPGLQEHEALALVAAAGALGPKVEVLVALLLLEGLKLAEVLELDIEHLEGSGWAMRATVARRGRTETIDLDGRTARALTAYLGGRASGPLLLGDSPHGHRGRLTRFGADFLLKKAAARAGLAPVSANTLRRTHIALSHRDGTPVADIALRVGHATPRDTRRYLP